MNHGDIYQPLPHSQRSIRLLNIIPGWPDEPIHVGLVTIEDITDAPAYIALSYVWGLTLAVDPIFCNGVSKRVTKSLGDALRALRPLPTADTETARIHGVDIVTVDDVCHSSRHIWRNIAWNKWEKPLECHTETLFIWIDALCINQDDREERSNQVKGMREIYQKAKSVRIWFGTELVYPAEEASREPVSSSWLDRLLGRISLTVYGDMPIILSFIAQAFHNSKQRSRSHDESLPGFPPANAPEWKILRRFFQHPWFYRVWTVQEIAMAQDAVLIVGDWELDWKSLSIALGYLYSTYRRYSLVWKSKAIWRVNIFDSSWTAIPLDAAIYMCRIKSEIDQRPLLMGLLELGRNQGATQPVDYVFAVLNLSADWRTVDTGITEKPYIEPDYTKSVAKTFTDVTTWLISFHRSLDVLSFVTHEEQDCVPEHLSWVPMWSHRKPSCALAHGEYQWSPEPSTLQSPHRRLLRETGYNADMKEPMLSTTVAIANTTTLQASGLSLSWVVAVSEKLLPVGDDDATLRNEATAEETRFIESVWQLCQRLIAQYDTHHHGPSGIPFDRAELIAVANELQMKAPYTTRDQIMDALILTLCANRDEDWKRADSSPETRRDATTWLSHVLGPRFAPVSGLAKARKLILHHEDRHAFQASISLICSWRRFFITQSGHMGISPLGTRKGDVVAVLFGSTIPFMVRPVDGRPSRYLLLGECYVQGIMDGELVKQWKQHLNTPAQVFHIQ